MMLLPYTLARYTRSWMVVSCIFLLHSFVLQASTVHAAGSQSPAAQVIDKPFYEAVTSSHYLADRFREQLNGLTLLPKAMLSTWQQVAAQNSPGYPFLLIIQICAVLLAGILLESFLRRRLRAPYEVISNPSASGPVYKLLHIGLGIALEGLFLLSFVVLTFSLYVLIFPEAGIAATIASNYLLGGYYIRILHFFLTVFLSPGRPFLRILPFADGVARSLFIWGFSLCAVEIFLARSGMIMKKSGADEAVLLAIIGEMEKNNHPKQSFLLPPHRSISV